MLKYRLITVLILIPLVIAALFLLPLLGFTLAVLIVCMLAAWEWGKLAGFTTYIQRVCLAVLCGFLLLVLMSLSHYSSSLSQVMSGSLWLSLYWWIGALLLVLSYPRSVVFWRHSYTWRIIFGMLTITPFFFGMIALRQYDYEQDHLAGAWLLLYIMLLVWGADSGAYLFGKLCGKRKLMLKISPNKTWEGLMGGLLTSALISWLVGRCAPLPIAPTTLLICSVFAAFASVLGDLAESMFKREAGIKDSGHLIPGHGGILDRIDSLTAAVPVFACLTLLVF